MKLRASRFRILLFLILALHLFALNFLRAQFPPPDAFDPNDPTVGSTNGASFYVSALAVQPDGKILVGGSFFTLGGEARMNIGRLHAEGGLDYTFDPGADRDVKTFAIQPDGKILLGGWFSRVGGQTRKLIARLHADGTLDDAFNPGADSDVFCLVVQADGKILAGGWFVTLAGQPRRRIGRLHADGTLDDTFDPGPGASSEVNCLAVQTDGKILVGGGFRNIRGQTRHRIARLHADGTLDDTFNPGASNSVYSLAVQTDGKILVGGVFTNLAGQTRNHIGRLNPNGTLDNAFNPGADSTVWSIVLQTDGKILVAGAFSNLAGQPRATIARLHADGTLDETLNPGASGGVNEIVVQADGKILAGGRFSALGGQPRRNIGRLNNTDPATQTLNYDGATITWQRGGASPEVWRTTFEHSDAGLAWTNLGAGTRSSGGWQLSGVTLPQEGILRARGHVTTGGFNGSGGIVETTLIAPWPICLRLVCDGRSAILSWTGGRGPYQVQRTTDLNQPGSWQDMGDPMQTNSISLPVVGSGPLFFRVRGQ